MARTGPPPSHTEVRGCSGGVRGIELGVVGKSKDGVVYRRLSAVACRSSSDECKSWAFMRLCVVGLAGGEPY
jgi:hypothetical protein